MLITDQAAIGTRLRQIRKSRKLSQAELAAATGISGKAYADIERGASNMRMDTMLKICQVLHITPDKLFVHEYDSSAYEVQAITQCLSGFSADDREKVVELLQIIQKVVCEYSYRSS